LNEKSISRAALDAFPAYDKVDVTRRCREALAKLCRKIVVLDDDPTGVQTVHGVHVYTDWSLDSIREGFLAPEGMFFLLTNSRSFDTETTISVHREIAGRVARVSRETGRDFLLISRGDSTLRGHYPLETQALRAALEDAGLNVDGEIILPFFPEGGRYTLDNVHYVASGDLLVPAGQTEYAKDKTFGYVSSDLTEWIEEKSNGAYAARDVVCIGLKELRARDYAAITRKLSAVSGFGKVIVNAVDYADLEVFAVALVAALGEGREFLYRSAAALPKVLGGVPAMELLSRQELVDTKNRSGGLILAGSHVLRTTQQLEKLRRADFITFVAFDQHLAVDEARLHTEQRRVISIAEREIAAGRTVAVFTRRERFDLNTGDREEELRLAVRISDAIAGIVSGLTVRPNFIIAKGGITSSDVGVKGLKVRKALVLGQILKGVPVWLTGPESRFPNMPFVIFPGNVGDEDALYDAVLKLQPDRQ
jgi:uncharacterized protein YgbK (DUF1537 family)